MKKIDPRDRSYVRTAEVLRMRYRLSELSSSESSGSLTGASFGDSLKLDSEGKLSVVTVDEAIWGDKRPISSGGVYTITGKIEEFLKKI